MRPLKTTLRNGDVVEILTQAGHQPSRDWLAVVKTSRARNKIRHVINAVERAKAVEIGQKSLEKEARRRGVSLGRISSDDLASVATEYGVSKAEDLYAALGFGRFSARQVLQKVAPEETIEPGAVEPPPLPRMPPPGSPAGRRRFNNSRERRGRCSCVSRQVLQSGTRGADRRLYHPGQGCSGAFGAMP